MKILRSTVATLSLLAISLAAPITILAATNPKTIKPTPTESPTPVPTIEATVAPTPVATPAPQTLTQWIMTHKKIDLGIIAVVVAAGYILFRRGKKGSESTPEEESKPEEPTEPEEPSEEEQTPPENTV